MKEIRSRGNDYSRPVKDQRNLPVLQGESSWVGMPCVFVRLTGCSLRCAWCDTAYAFHEGKENSLEGILGKVKSYGVKLVEITGGEPLEQEGVYALMDGLLVMGFEVLLETSGAVDLGRVPREVVKIMDIKCPGSGEEKRNLWTNLEKLVPWQDEIKFVIRDGDDFNYAKVSSAGMGVGRQEHPAFFAFARGT